VNSTRIPGVGVVRVTGVTGANAREQSFRKLMRDGHWPPRRAATRAKLRKTATWLLSSMLTLVGREVGDRHIRPCHRHEGSPDVKPTGPEPSGKVVNGVPSPLDEKGPS